MECHEKFTDVPEMFRAALYVLYNCPLGNSQRETSMQFRRWQPILYMTSGHLHIHTKYFVVS